MIHTITSIIGLPSCLEVKPEYDSRNCCSGTPTSTQDAKDNPIPSFLEGYEEIQFFHQAKTYPNWNITTNRLSDCHTLKTAHSTTGCCPGKSATPFSGISLLGDVTLPASEKVVQIFEEDYLLHLDAQYGDGNGKKQWNLRYLADMHTTTDGQKVMDLYIHWMGMCGSALYGFGLYPTNPCGDSKFYPDETAKYTWREVYPKSRAVYDAASKAYVFTAEEWNKAQVSNYGEAWSETLPFTFYNDMTLTGDYGYIDGGAWLAATPNNALSKSKDKKQLFNADGSLKACSSFWMYGGWGESFKGRVEVDADGHNELFYDEKYAPMLWDASNYKAYGGIPYQKKVTRFNPQNKVYEYHRAQDGFTFNHQSIGGYGHWGSQCGIAWNTVIVGSSYDSTKLIDRLKVQCPGSYAATSEIVSSTASNTTASTTIRWESVVGNEGETAKCEQCMSLLSTKTLPELNQMLDGTDIVLESLPDAPVKVASCPYGHHYDYWDSEMGRNVYCEGGSLATYLMSDFGCDD
tara:strand:- start:4173 stop:5726 length:1554 start_codon:yes stop_codon:yes gene_type:complete